MEPRPDDRGNNAIAELDAIRRLMLQWSPDLMIGETIRLRVGEAEDLDASMEPRPDDRGNSRPRPSRGAARRASMEPRPDDRGNGRTTRSTLRGAASFNGAPT